MAIAPTSLYLSGLASGIDTRSLIDQIVSLRRRPITRLQNEQSGLTSRSAALATLISQLQTLRKKAEALSETSLFANNRVATSSDLSIASASTGSLTPMGTYGFKFFQLATTSVQSGATNVALGVNTGQAVTSTAAGFATAVTAGTFTVNSRQITVSTSDTLDNVLNNINTAGAGVTAFYDSASDKITLSSGSAIVLGSGADTSNFLQAARLSSNGTSSVTSSTKVGGINLGDTLASARFRTALTTSGGSGQFSINGVSINFTTADTVNDVLSRINSSAAGVTAAYDSSNDRVVLTNKETGSTNITMSDVTGNFLAAARVSSGTLTTGQDLLYTLNDGALMTSRSNTLTEDETGVAGLTVTAKKAAPVPTALLSSFNNGQDTFDTVADNSYTTGTAIKFMTSGSLPGVDTLNTYYLRPVDSNTFKVYQTADDAFADNNEVNLNGSLSGTNRVVSAAPASVTVTVGSDTSAIKEAITDFVETFNQTQSLLSLQTAVSTSASGKVTAGVLSDDRDVTQLASALRSKAMGDVSGLSGTIKRLQSLGYTSDGYSNQLTLKDSSALDNALANSLDDLTTLFSDSSSGVGTRLDQYLEGLIGDNGSLLTRQNSLATQSSRIDTQIGDVEGRVEAERQRLVQMFASMEQAVLRSNKQSEFIRQRFFGAISS